MKTENGEKNKRNQLGQAKLCISQDSKSALQCKDHAVVAKIKGTILCNKKYKKAKSLSKAWGYRKITYQVYGNTRVKSRTPTDSRPEGEQLLGG